MQEFVFEVLVVFVESLALAHSDEKALGKRSSVASSELLPFIDPITRHVLVLWYDPYRNCTAVLQCFGPS